MISLICYVIVIFLFTIYSYLHISERYLFVFNFHWIKYGCFDFINNVYIPYIRRTFHHRCNFVFYGPSKSDKYPIKYNGLKENGYYSYYTIVQAYYDEKSIYSGYFLLNDDSFFDPVVFFRKGYNLTIPIIEGIGFISNNISSWSWPKKVNYKGITFRQAYLNFIQNICQKKSIYGLKYANSRLCSFDRKRNIGGYADFLYIPHSYITDYIILFDLAYKEGMFLEMAVSTISYMFKYVTLGKKCYYINLIGICPHVHPIKFSNKNNRDIVYRYINNSPKILYHNNSYL